MGYHRAIDRREEGELPVDVDPYLRLMVDKGASDLFLSVGAPPYIKVEGRMRAVGSTALTGVAVETFANALMDDMQAAEFERAWEMNLAVSRPQIGRFRVNVFRQRNEVAIVIRNVKTELPKIEGLGLPPLLRELVMRPRGLIVVAGATGSGKSTTLAAMLDHRNENASGHILTIEDPVEFLHRHKRSLINQREVGFDTHSYHTALRNAMREAPDVIMIGEILDRETMEAAISFAETGHLCLTTLHANNADQTLDRILSFFPESTKHTILMNLSMNLQAIVSQRLTVGVDGRRVPAVEVLINTPLTRDIIRGGRLNELKEAMERSLENGMQSFDQALYRLYQERRISREEALAHADSREGLALRMRLNEGSATSTLATPEEEALY
jgi:twitching motility protein PilU